MKNPLSKQMQPLRIIEKICSGFLLILLMCALFLFFYSLYDSEGLTTFRNSLILLLKWGPIISVTVLIVSATVEFISAFKENS